jgi:hypothetical protein
MSLIFAPFAPLVLYNNVLLGVGGLSLIVTSVVSFWFINYLIIWAMA